MAEPEPRRLCASRRPQPQTLRKHNSWSPDMLRDEAWTNRRRNHRLRRGGSVMDDDLDELRGCLDLGFQFDSPDLDPRLSSTFPALELYRAVNQRQYGREIFRSVSFTSRDSDGAAGSSSSAGSPGPIIDPVDDPETMKTRLRHWAQVVACSVRQFSACEFNVTN